MAVTVLLEVQTKDGQSDALIGALKENILPDTRKYDGFLNIEVIQNQDDPNTLILVEEWESKTHYEAYLQWRTERGDMDTLMTFLAGTPSIRYFDKTGA